MDGPIAQLGERLNGIQEVSGSIPLGSTQNERDRSSVWLERRPVKAEVAGSSPVGPAVCVSMSVFPYRSSYDNLKRTLLPSFETKSHTTICNGDHLVVSITGNGRNI